MFIVYKLTHRFQIKFLNKYGKCPLPDKSNGDLKWWKRYVV